MGLILGSVGVGNIGAEMFRLARPLDMRFIAHDPYADPALAAELDISLTDLDTVFRESDFVCVNCPLSDETHHLVSRASHSERSATGTTRSPRISPPSFIAPSQSPTGLDDGGKTWATGLPKRVTSTGLRVFPTQSRTARQVALNFEI